MIITKLEKEAEKLVNETTFKRFMREVWFLVKTKKVKFQNKKPDIYILNLAKKVFLMYLKLRGLSQILSRSEVQSLTLDQLQKSFNQYSQKCIRRIIGGLNVTKKKYIKRSYVICDNLTDVEEELLDINNYLYFLYLKYKYYKDYLIHEIVRYDYRFNS